ncbi:MULTISPECIES: threonine/serine exporter family protein [unclassified Dysgonomonas]|uniref:threonine/serine exporter family protein n=1 Tax=unclassified Dysgonomonas TaxID=2630389 RepID=UPI000682EC74|nr:MULTISPECIES: threonine/serine exporter family protein [unclassified Dysgonomonas]MBD8346591.1 threonine/serine exporter family protein [Dysgonomonas sp. HGC4]MBF0574492.1 threonine/serine exporter family protein [Dysgonomonas sp. GY617]
MTDFIFLMFKDAAFAFLVAVGFALLFETPKRVLYVAGLLGGIGHCIRFILLHFDFGLVSSTLAGSIFIGIAGIYCAHKVHTPPVVFTMPACITMIPGLYAYRTMMGWIKIYTDGLITQEPHILQETAYNFILTSSLLFSLAIGICVGALFFRKKSTKEIKLGKTTIIKF